MKKRIKSILMLLIILTMVLATPLKAVKAAPLPGYNYKISPYCAPTRFLDISNGSLNNGANCQIWSSNSTLAQVFKLQAMSDGSYVFFNLKSGKVLDVDNGIAQNGRNVQQYEYNGSDAQKWYLEENADQSITIVSKLNTNYVLDISNGINKDGTNVQIWQRGGVEAQKFSFSIV